MGGGVGSCVVLLCFKQSGVFKDNILSAILLMLTKVSTSQGQCDCFVAVAISDLLAVCLCRRVSARALIIASLLLAHAWKPPLL